MCSTAIVRSLPEEALARINTEWNGRCGASSHRKAAEGRDSGWKAVAPRDRPGESKPASQPASLARQTRTVIHVSGRSVGRSRQVEVVGALRRFFSLSGGLLGGQGRERNATEGASVAMPEYQWRVWEMLSEKMDEMLRW